MVRLLLSLGLVLTTWSTLSGEMRTWTDKQGRAITARLSSVEGDQISIVRDDGRSFTLELSVLSAADRDYVREWSAKPSAKVIAAAQWPTRVQHRSPDVEIVLEEEDTNIYRTKHFEFQSDARLSRTLVSEFGEIFESTLAAVQALPIGLDVEAPEDDYFVTRLFSKTSAYLRAGGVPGSGGLYNPRVQQILIPIKSLGVKSSSTGYSFDRYKDNHALVHEITHQIMHPWLEHLPAWLIEGFAVYMETIPYDRGVFRFRQHDLSDYLANKTRGLGSASLPIAPLDALMDLSRQDWNDAFAHKQQTIPANYYTALLLTHYFLHLDGEGDAFHLIRYLQELRAGTGEDTAREILLDGRTVEELEDEVVTALRRKRIRVTNR